ncbi:processed acidic surface protein [Bacillus sp. Marseille-Q3570]|uniref:processed acidic surface protein n=1 Tax=Bacillus sp. Marseille-Q3570 TaxID=2963522 RepID=UPI0021B77F05|nr:processed acidic surface protein [Bacillus sp. Marseille-Q3570]
MKRFLIAFFITVICVVTLPFNASAEPAEKELQSYLNEIGWTKEEITEYLDFHDYTLEDFENMDDLKDFLGPVLTVDIMNELIEEYGLTLKEATELLVSNGELEEGESILDVYTFRDDLDSDLYFYSLTPITDETLVELLDQYNMTLEELEALLAENDDELANYETIEDLEFMLDFYINGPEIDMTEFDDLLNQIGFTDEEFEKLWSHFETLNYEDPTFLVRLDNLANRMMAFEEFDTATELSAEQIAELLDIFNELLDLFELDVKFYLVKGDEIRAISLTALMALEDAQGYDLKIELYNKQGELLADFLFTAEMFGSEFVKEVGSDLKQTEKVVQKPVAKTVKGAKLPKTASHYIENTAAGILAAMFGFILYRRIKVRNV